jgi:hypothetical protein
MGTCRPRFFIMILSGHDSALRVSLAAWLCDPMARAVTPNYGWQEKKVQALGINSISSRAIETLFGRLCQNLMCARLSVVQPFPVDTPAELPKTGWVCANPPVLNISRRYDKC